MTCSLVDKVDNQIKMTDSERFQHCTDVWSKLAGGRKITYDNAVFLSERSCADTNFALAYLMKSRGAFPKDVDLVSVLEFYFMCCSLEVDCET